MIGFEMEGNTMKRRAISFLILLLLVSPSAWAYDIDIFDECSVAIKPNVMFLMDTSLSMRRQDVLDNGIESYNSEGAFIITRDGAGNVTDVQIDPNNDADDPATTQVEEQSYIDRGYVGERGQTLSQNSDLEDNIFYWNDSLDGWYKFYPTRYLELHEIQNEDVLEAFLRFGTFQGDLDKHGNIEDDTNEENVYATGDYINYLKYVEIAQAGINWDPDNEYDATIDYRRFHNTNATEDPLGYGEYDTNKVYVRMAGDIRAFNGVRNSLKASVPNGIYINDPDSTGRQIINCTTAKGELEAEGVTESKVWEIGGCSCGGLITYTLMTGNFLNYLDMKTSRRYNGIDAIWNVVSNRPNDARYGIMQFDLGVFSKFFDLTHWETQGGELSAECGASQDDIKRVLYGKFDHENRSRTMEERWHPLHFGHPSDISKETPLAEALIEAGCYFAGKGSWFNLNSSGDPRFTYTSPIQCDDQENHVIIITDGAPKDDFELLDGLFTTSEAKGLGTTWRWIEEKNFHHYSDATVSADGTNPSASSTIGNYNDVKPTDDDCLAIAGNCLYANYRQRWLDDVAKFLNEKDLSPIAGRQSLNTHVIGFVVAANADSLDRPLMIETANAGEGHYAFTSSKEGLIAELNSILHTVMEDFSFSSASTPVSQSDMVYSGNDMYMSSFMLESGARGRGNILKYNRDNDVVTGASSAVLFETDGDVDTDTRDLWYPGQAPTGNDPEDPIPLDGLARKLYSQIQPATGLGASPTPEDIFNAVKSKRKIYIPYRAGLSGWTLGDVGTVATDGTIAIPKEDGTSYSGDELYSFLSKKIYGYGYNWPMGDIIHSNIVVAQYPDSEDQDYGVTSYVFVGTNTGKLHCFNAESNGTGAGRELWSLIYPDFKDRLHQLESFFDKDERWFADGWITLYNEHVPYDAHETKVTDGANIAYYVVQPSYLIAGERRGGSSYHILDITDKNNPEYKAKIGGSDPWGQSWSKPDLCQVVKDGAVETAFLVAGGYDTNQDKLLPGTDQKGRFVALYDLDGDLLKRFPDTGVGSEACIVAARIIDHDHTLSVDNERVFSRIYAGDLRGNVYHSTDDLNTSGQPKTPDGSWDLQHKLFSGHYEPVTLDGATGRLHQKIFYSPVAGMACATDRVFFGTGDREHPLLAVAGFSDSVYCVPESWNKTFSRDDLNKFILDVNNIVPDSNVGGGVTKEIYNNIRGVGPANKDTCEGTCEEAYRNCLRDCERGDDSCSLACTMENSQCEMLCGSGWYFDFVRGGEKMISEVIVIGDVLIFGTYTPPSVTVSADVCNAGGTCVPGAGRVYVVSTCEDAFSVKSYKLKNNPMPQPALVFDKKTGKVLVSTGDGQIIDPELPVIVPDYWKHSGADL